MSKDKISLFGVTGKPIIYSQSPQLFHHGYRIYKKKKSNENTAYIRVIADSSHEVLDLAKQIPLKGINITSPYKEEIAKRVELHEEAANIKSVNTLKITQEGFDGYNTDICGIAEILKKIKIYEYSTLFLIGAGGAAKAILYYLHTKNIKCYICNRTIAKAVLLGDQFGCAAIPYSDMEKCKMGKSIFFVTTPPDSIPFDETVIEKNDLIVSVHYVKDIFKEIARKRHAHYINGEKWLIGQAVKAFTIFTEKKPILSHYSFKQNNRADLLKKKIVFIGIMGSGKTQTGKILSEKILGEFYDTDDEIQEKEKMQIKNIFDQYGESYFRKREAETLEKMMEKHYAKTVSVFSTGGGAVLSENNRKMLHNNAYVFWLYCNPEKAFMRISQDLNRPLLNTLDKKAFIELCENRKFLYAQTCDCFIDTTYRTAEETAQRIYNELKIYINGKKPV